MLYEGAKVAWIGPEEDGLAIGDVGTVLEQGATGSHVRWDQGLRQGQIVLVRNDDLVISTSHNASLLDDSLDTPLLRFSARQVFDARGEVGVVKAMETEGHLASWTSYAEEAFSMVSKRISEDPAMREVLAVLDEYEGQEVVRRATLRVLRTNWG